LNFACQLPLEEPGKRFAGRHLHLRRDVIYRKFNTLYRFVHWNAGAIES
jgi:hypothetical protein